MKITKKCEYGILALIDLALNYGKGLRQAQDIVHEEKIPEKFLEQILIILKNGGLIQSKRGVGGGYYLIKPPHDISLGEIIRLIDGPISTLECVGNSNINCPKEITCGIRSVIVEVENATAEILDHVTLAHLCNIRKGLSDKKKDGLMYYI